MEGTSRLSILEGLKSKGYLPSHEDYLYQVKVFLTKIFDLESLLSKKGEPIIEKFKPENIDFSKFYEVSVPMQSAIDNKIQYILDSFKDQGYKRWLIFFSHSRHHGDGDQNLDMNIRLTCGKYRIKFSKSRLKIE